MFPVIVPNGHNGSINKRAGPPRCTVRKSSEDTRAGHASAQATSVMQVVTAFPVRKTTTPALLAMTVGKPEAVAKRPGPSFWVACPATSYAPVSAAAGALSSA